MQNSSNYEQAEHFPLNDKPWIFASDLTEAGELVEAGTALGVSSGLILDAIRTYGSEVVRRAMAVTARDVTRLAGIH